VEVAALGPLLVLVAPAVGAPLVYWAPGIRSVRLAAVGASGLALAGILLAIASVLTAGTAPTGTPYLRIDALSAVVLLLLGLVGVAAVVYSVGYFGRPENPHALGLGQLRRYYALVLLFLFTMFLVAEANDLGLLWIALEGTTLVSALLVGFYRTPGAIEASWKYLILCTVGLLFALFGTLLLYLASTEAVGAGGASLDWTVLVDQAPHLDLGLVRLALVFLFLGYGTKAGFAPLHTWLPDAHSEAPTPVSALLSAGLLNCALYALLRVDAIAVQMPGQPFAAWLFLGFGLLSVAFGAVFLLVQQDLKRLLAYSSVEHVGIIAVGIGIGGALAVFAALFHMLNHAVSKAALFLAGGELTLATGTKDLTRISGTLTALPSLGALLLVGGLALAGVPPFSMFASEFLILNAGWERGLWWVAVALIAALTLVFGGLCLHLSRLLLGPRPETGAAPFPGRLAATSLALGLLLPFVVGLGVFLPNPLAELLRDAARVVTG
jgi:hydrogenase-4 component F